MRTSTFSTCGSAFSFLVIPCAQKEHTMPFTLTAMSAVSGWPCAGSLAFAFASLPISGAAHAPAARKLANTNTIPIFVFIKVSFGLEVHHEVQHRLAGNAR